MKKTKKKKEQKKRMATSLAVWWMPVSWMGVESVELLLEPSLTFQQPMKEAGQPTKKRTC
jgi:hypothetical protein